MISTSRAMYHNVSTIHPFCYVCFVFPLWFYFCLCMFRFACVVSGVELGRSTSSFLETSPYLAFGFTPSPFSFSLLSSLKLFSQRPALRIYAGPCTLPIPAGLVSTARFVLTPRMLLWAKPALNGRFVMGVFALIALDQSG